MSEQDRQPELFVRSAQGPVRGVVLVLPGGRSQSLRPTTNRQLTRLRMLPFVRALGPARDRGTEVGTLGYRVRGWNGETASPVADARWALARVQRRHPDVPVVLVGHSMGGRAALRCASDPAVRGVAALAPWLPDGEPITDFTGKDLLVAHGTRDRVTDPGASRAYVRAVADQPGARVRECWPEDGHAMLTHPGRWHQLVARFVLAVLTGEPMPGAAANAWGEQARAQPGVRAE